MAEDDRVTPLVLDLLDPRRDDVHRMNEILSFTDVIEKKS
jgi:hypothetical protein